MIHLLEETLDVSFSPGRLRLANVQNAQLQAAGYALQEHYSQFKLPGKAANHLRPFISPSVTASHEVGLEYVFGDRHFSESLQYFFDGETYGLMTKAIKRYLLYSHSLCIVDPLPYLLDYFRLAPEAEEARRRRPAVLALMHEYAALRALLDEEILIPVSEPILQPVDAPIIPKELVSSLHSRLPGEDPAGIRIMLQVIGREWKRRTQLSNRIDLFLPSRSYADVLTEVMHDWELEVVSDDARVPLRLSMLESLPGVDADLIDIEDIVRIRRDDELFDEWRRMLGRVLDRLHDRNQEYTDMDGELDAAVREEMADWKSRILREKRRGSVLGRLFDSKRSVAIGVTAGAIAGAMAGGPPGGAVGGAIGGAVAPVVEFIWDMVGMAEGRGTRASMTSHFLVVGGALET